MQGSPFPALLRSISHIFKGAEFELVLAEFTHPLHKNGTPYLREGESCESFVRVQRKLA